MGRTPKDITEAELAVLEFLWQQGPATIRAVQEALYPTGGTSSYATVQKLLERLEAKRAVKRDRRRMPHVFRAAMDREALIGRRLRDVADQLCGGSLTPLLTHLLRREALSESEREELRQLVEELDPSSEEGGAAR